MSLAQSKANKIKSIFSIIFIGALGSGLWDIFLKDTIYYAGSLIVSLFSSFYDGYFDYLYSGVGYQKDRILYAPGILIFTLVILFPLFVYLRLNRVFRDDLPLENDNQSELTKNSILDSLINNPVKFKVVMVSIVLFFSIIYSSVLISSLSTSRAISVVKQQIEIIRPYVSEKESQHLISKFRLVDNKAKLQALLSEINVISYKSDVKLPTFRLYGIDTSNNTP